MHSSSKAAALLFIFGLLYWAWLQLAPLLGEEPAYGSPQESSQLAHARSRAQDTLPQFLRMLDLHQGQSYRAEVRVRFREGARSELLWVEQPKFSLRGLTGQVAGSPKQLGGFQKGQTVTVHTRDIVDWGFVSSREPPKGYYLTCAELRTQAADVELRARLRAEPAMCDWADAQP